MCVGMCAMVHVWRSGDNFVESVLSLHHYAGSRIDLGQLGLHCKELRGAETGVKCPDPLVCHTA